MSENKATNGTNRYHLVKNGVVLRGDDEALEPDCLAWWRLDSHPSGRIMIGLAYTNQLFVPVRRRDAAH